MEAQLFVVLLLVVGIYSQFTIPDFKQFNCNKDVPPHALNLTAMSGYWYEAARIPNFDILKCLNVSVPATVDDVLRLDLEYVSTIRGRIRAVRENITFAWDNQTKNSVFILDYGSFMNRRMSVTYKVVYTDPQLVTIICGFSGISPMPLFKLLTRQQQVNQNIKDYVQAEADKVGLGNRIIWTDQSPGHCNAAVRPKAGIYTILAISILWSFSK